MKHFNPVRHSLAARILAVAFIVLAILVISFCAAVMSVIYMHADEKGMVPRSFSLSAQSNQPIITILPREPGSVEDKSAKTPKYQI